MSDLLDRLAERTLVGEAPVRPRLPGLFEPRVSGPGTGPDVEAGLEVETTTEPTRPAPAPPAAAVPPPPPAVVTVAALGEKTPAEPLGRTAPPTPPPAVPLRPEATTPVAAAAAGPPPSGSPLSTPAPSPEIHATAPSSATPPVTTIAASPVAPAGEGEASGERPTEAEPAPQDPVPSVAPPAALPPAAAAETRPPQVVVVHATAAVETGFPPAGEAAAPSEHLHTIERIIVEPHSAAAVTPAIATEKGRQGVASVSGDEGAASAAIVAQPRITPLAEPIPPVVPRKPPPSPPTIKVSIGRVEVRAAAPAAPAPARRKEPAVMSLDEYLKRRAGGS